MATLPESEANGWVGWPAVTVYTDIPVHVSSQGKGLERGGSAFLTLMHFMESDAWVDYNERVQSLQHRRLRLVPALRRATPYFVAKNWAMVSKALDAALPDADPKLRASFHSAASALFIPVVPQTGEGFVKEAYQLVADAASSNLPEWLKLRKAFDLEGFGQFRRQVADVILRAFQRADALVPALAYERMQPGVDLREFQIFRGDLDVLKSLYVDLFELSSRCLAYLGAISNLNRRGDSDKWLDGKTRTLGRALAMRAVDREFILGELPECAKLYAGLNRHTRNDFGHCKVHYDFSTGCLVDQDGKEENFLLFLADLLGGVRCSAVALLLVAYVDEEPPEVK